jgi:hypothetical protein
VSIWRQVKKSNLNKDLATCRLSKLISLHWPSSHSCRVWSFVLAAILLTLAASHRAPAHDAAHEVAAEKHAPANYLNAQPGVEYVGEQVCGSCHPLEYKSFKQTAMGRSASVPSPDDLQSLIKPVAFSSEPLNRTYTVYSRNRQNVPRGIAARRQGPAYFLRYT